MSDIGKYDADLGSVCAFCDKPASKKIEGTNVCDNQFCRYLAWATPTSHEDQDPQVQEGPQR